MFSFRYLLDCIVLCSFLLNLGTGIVDALIKPGRRVCPVSRASLKVVPSEQTYIRPFTVPCNNTECGNSSRIIYKVATRTVFYRRVIHDAVRKCCPGWTSFEPNDQDCMKPICKSKCLHGGTCNGPEYCLCPRNFTGAHCEYDVDECKTGRHDCHQQCNNTFGGYQCYCYDGFRMTYGGQCEFCPLCLQEFEHVMNKVDDLQTRLKSVESSKETIQEEFIDLQKSYKVAIDKVGELQKAQLKASLTTTVLPQADARINPRNNFDLITSLSEQMGAIEEQIGQMMTEMITSQRGQRSRNQRKSKRRP